MSFCKSHNIFLSWNVKVVVVVSTENKDSNDITLKLQEMLLATIFLKSRKHFRNLRDSLAISYGCKS